MKKIVEIDEKRFVALAELGMTVTFGKHGECPAVISNRLSSELCPDVELNLYRLFEHTDDWSKLK